MVWLLLENEVRLEEAHIHGAHKMFVKFLISKGENAGFFWSDHGFRFKEGLNKSSNS